MIWHPLMDVRVRLAAAFASSAFLVAAGALRYAVRVPKVPPDPPVTWTTDTAAMVIRRDAPVALTALDPFGEIRTGAMNAPSNDSAPLVPITLIGTIAGASQPTAVCRLGSQSPRLLHLGDTLGGWRLQQVAAGRVIFVDAAGAPHELRLSSLGK